MSTNLQARSAVVALEKAMVGLDPDFSEGLAHYFGDKTYAREMTLEKGDLVVGKLHRFSCINILSKGEVVVEGEFESDTYTSPHTWVSPAGTKRAIYAKTACVWTGIFHIPDNVNGLEEIERYLIVDEPEMLAGVF